MERHPRIDSNDFPLMQSRIILGSFPTWSLTEADLTKSETEELKAEVRLSNDDILFYYGSRINRFWDWYKMYFDPLIDRKNIDTIQSSLKTHQIGVTDMILSCDRKDRSALDKHLKGRIYNRNFLNLKGDNITTTKILCTSKGVMNEMLFSDSYFYTQNQLTYDKEGAKNLEKLVMQYTGGNLEIISHPIYKRIKIDNGSTIECFALPSPGSPYRRLKDFGCDSKKQNVKFLESYLTFVFNWFKL